MKSDGKPPKRDRLKALLEWKRKEKTSPTPPQIPTTEASTGSTAISAPPVQDRSGDSRRATTRYLEAAKALEEVVNGCKSQWGSFDFPELKGEPINPTDLQFKHKIDTVLEAQKSALKDQTAWEKCKHTIQCVFSALSPFAKNFLAIATHSQSIPILNPYGLLCGGLLLFITIADKEVGRKEEVERTLNFMYQQLEQLEILDILPEELEQRESVISRAIDVRSAAMIYLAVNIYHQTTPLGDMGKVFKTFFVGDEKITNSTEYLKTSIDDYCRVLNNIHARISIKSYQLHIEGHKLLKELAALHLQNNTEENQIEDKFLVPFQKNPLFIGRTRFLQMLKEKLSTQASRRFNHRIALYGMGGIGKTQCALGYVYANRTTYNRIYWISAVDQMSLLSGYQSIAKHAKLPGLQSATSIEIAEAVLSWLKQEQKWLLVIDNLDDIQVAGRFLPENGPENHTLITTRDPNTKDIPAEPLEVPLLDPEDAVDLLSTLSEIHVPTHSEQRKQADKIVKELGYLPLAVEQAGAFTRAMGFDFETFSEEYQKNHKELHRWVPKANRPYSYSVATTWSMSFKVIQNESPHIVKLLRLLSFLNPDGILIELLTSGADILEEDLRQVVSSRLELAKGLLELEKFSLIKWDRQKKTIQIHRLVQMVVKAEISDADSVMIRTSIINLCDQSFPKEWNNENLAICRLYSAQLMWPLVDPEASETNKSAVIMGRVGRFLREDGKIIDSERLLVRSFEIRKRILGAEHPDTLMSMNNLALAYWDQGRTAEVADLEEEVLKKRRRILGAEHPDTLTSMNNLALAYRDQGRTVEAVNLQEEVLEKYWQMMGAEHPDTLTSMDNLAFLYRAQGRMAEAADLQKEVLKKRWWILGVEHPHTLTSMSNIALMYRDQGRMAEAVDLQKEVLEKRRRILGTEHPHTLTSMSNIALTYRDQGRIVEAADLQKEVLEKRWRILGAEHPDTLKSMSNIAFLYQAQGRTAEAVNLQKEVLEKHRRILGAEHPHTLTSMSNIALMYRDQGRMAEATDLQKEVLEKHRQILGAEHPHTLTSMGNIAFLYRAQGRAAEAVDLQKEVLKKHWRILGAEHPHTLTSMSNIALTYRDQGRIAEAANLQKEVLEKHWRILGAEHPHTLTSMSNMAFTYRDQGRMAEAAFLQKEVLEKRRRILGVEHPDTVMSMNNLALTYWDQGRTMEAVDLEKKVLKKRQ